MGKDAKQVANETANKIVRDLIQTQRSEPLTKEDAIQIISQHFEDAYAEVNVEDKTALYKALSILFHPDKKFAALDPKFFLYMEQLEITSEPFKVLNRLNGKRLFTGVTNNSTDRLKSFIQFIMYLMSPMQESLNRYPEPFRFLANTVSLVLYSFAVVIAIVSVLLVVLSNITLAIANNIVSFVLNLITENQYNKEIYNNIEHHFEEHKKKYLINIRELRALINEQEADRIRNMTDDELFELLIQEEFQTNLNSMSSEELLKLSPRNHEELLNSARENYRQVVRDSVAINDLVRLKLLSIALFNSITKPLNEVDESKLTSIFIVRPLQVIASPFIITTAIFLELSRYIIVGAIFAGAGITSLFLVAALATLNAPLFVLDLCRYSVRTFQEGVYGNEKSEVSGNNESPRSLLRLEWHKENSLTESVIPPIHTDSLFATSRSRQIRRLQLDVPETKEDASLTY